jgi:hypothetical protein
MNFEHADKVLNLLRNRGYKAEIHAKNNYVVCVYGAEGQEREIRNAVPMFWWFCWWLHATTIHEPDNKIIVEFD